jgi:hypothetical protein
MAEIDPKLVYANAEKLLNNLARMTQAILHHWEDAPPEVKVHVGNAAALIVKLQTYEEAAPGIIKQDAPEAPRPAPKVRVVPRDSVMPPEAGKGSPLAVLPDNSTVARLKAKQQRSQQGVAPPQRHRPSNPFEKV